MCDLKMLSYCAFSFCISNLGCGLRSQFSVWTSRSAAQLLYVPRSPRWMVELGLVAGQSGPGAVKTSPVPGTKDEKQIPRPGSTPLIRFCRKLTVITIISKAGLVHFIRLFQ